MITPVSDSEECFVLHARVQRATSRCMRMLFSFFGLLRVLSAIFHGIFCKLGKALCIVSPARRRVCGVSGNDAIRYNYRRT
jgi:hypothetical protein